MKYSVNTYLTSKDGDSLILQIVSAIDGPTEVYGLVNPKHPGEIVWYTLEELIHGELEPVEPDFAQFDNLKAGDMIVIHKGNHACKVLAVSGRAALLSKELTGSDHVMRAHEVASSIARGLGIPEPSEEHLEEAREENSIRQQQVTADQWYDFNYMTLMNFKPVRE
jgi:hypothetical protein